MRILHVTDGYRPHLGGIEVFVEDLAHRQAAAGHEVTVLTAARDRSPDAAAAGLDTDAVRVVRTPATVRHPIAARRAREVALAGAYDVVHAHLSVLSPFATAVAQLSDEAGIATVNTVHSMWLSRRPVVRTVRSLADWDRSTLAWTAVSHAAAREVRALLAPGTTVSVVPNAVDVDWWRSGPRRSSGGGSVTVVSVMRIAGRKRPFALLRMLEELRARVPGDVDLRALVVGDGPLTNRMREELDRRGLSGWVNMLGRRTREEIRDLYAAADVYVAPAYEESFGIAALEARAAGVPVVAMRSGGVGEFVEHGVEGLLCDDDAEMTAALALLCAHPEHRAALAARNAAVRPLQDWPRTLTELDAVYRQLREGKEALRRDAVTEGRGLRPRRARG